FSAPRPAGQFADGERQPPIESSLAETVFRPALPGPSSVLPTHHVRRDTLRHCKDRCPQCTPRDTRRDAPPYNTCEQYCESSATETQTNIVISIHECFRSPVLTK